MSDSREMPRAPHRSRPLKPALSLLIIGLILAGAVSATAATDGDVQTNIHVPAFTLPESSLLGRDTRSALDREALAGAEASRCPSLDEAPLSKIPEIRECEAHEYYASSGYRALREKYAVVVETKRISGVFTEIFTPSGGVAPGNRERVLINLHGGGFTGGARMTSHGESIPIASVGRIKVISIDYRQAPEYLFPAASEDVSAVYQELLKRYRPQNIGIYGCSAGGLLTAETIAWLQKEHLPLPGAIGLFCEGGVYWTEGDSGVIGAAVIWGTGDTIQSNLYFKNTNPADPLAFPARSLPVLAKFPPTLFITGTRDTALSSVVYTHSRLSSQGVVAELHIWEGMGHAFLHGSGAAGVQGRVQDGS